MKKIQTLPGKLLTIMPVLLLSFFLLHAQSQPGIVHGTIRDGNGNPLPGASVKVAETGQGLAADENGNYRISLPAGSYRLEFAHVGHTTQTLQIRVTGGSETERNISLVSTAVEQETVMVVGSRNPKRSATNSPVPVDIIPLRQISNQVGQLDVTSLLTYLAPSFNSVRQALGDGTDHIDPAQLRGLGPDQVLVLVNGKRYHQSSLVNVNGTVNRGTVGTDLNSIPASAIDRIEILRDGASAQYGSDAIAGVINIVLKKRTGLSLSASYGGNVTSYDKYYAWNKLNPSSPQPGHYDVVDGQNFQAAANYGIPIKKGYLELSAEFLHRCASNRTGLYTGQVWPSVHGVDKSDSINAARGLNRGDFDMRVGNTEIKGGSFVVNFAYPLRKNLELYFTGMANLKNGYTFGIFRYPFNVAVGGSGSFPANNPNSVTAQALVSTLYPNGFLPAENSRVRDYHLSAGVRGKLGSWNLDASETFGANSYNYLVAHSVNYTQAYVPGITAQQLQTSFNSGKTRLFQSTTNVDFSKNHHVLQGLNTAFGAELRVDGYGIDAGEYNSYANLSDSNSLAPIQGAQVFAGFIPANAGTWTRTSFSVYSDNELDITNRWLLAGALRFEHFSDFGSTLNYKVATRYKLTDWLSVRGATSTGFRAPSLAQEHYSKVTTLFVTNSQGVSVPAQVGTFTNDSKVAQILGIPKLKQETSISYSLGVTAQLARGLDLTIDAYQIDIENRIVLSNTFTGNNNAALTAALVNAGASQAAVFANAINTRSRGIEGVLSYTAVLGRQQSLNISLASSFLQNKVRRNSDGNIIIHASPVLLNTGQISRYFTRQDQARIEVESPRQKDVLAVQYKYGKFGVLGRVSFFGKVSYWADSTNKGNFAANAFDKGAVQSLDQTFGSKFITDLSFSYTFARKLTANIGTDNLFDVYPDKQAHSGNVSSGRFTYARTVSQFGYNGRYIYGRLTLAL